MRDDGDLARALESEVPRRRGSKAVPSRPDPGDPLRLERADDGVDGGLPAVGSVSPYPGSTVEVGAGHRVFGECVSLEKVGHDRAVAIPREVVDEELYRITGMR